MILIKEEFSRKIQIYKGDTLMKVVHCPGRLVFTYFNYFLYKDSPYRIESTLADGTVVSMTYQDILPISFQ